MRKCVETALFLMLFASGLAADPLTFDGPAAVEICDPHRALVVVDTDGDGRADHLFRLWSERELPRMREAFVRAHVEFEPHRLRILAGEREICLALGDLPSEPGAVTGYGLNHEWGGAAVGLHRIVVEGGAARYVAEPGAK
jgi:hypothetical protein